MLDIKQNKIWRKKNSASWILIAALLFIGCNGENVTTCSSLVDKQEVSFNFFETEISDIGSRAETSSEKALAETNLYSELEVAMIAENQELDTINVVRQLSTDSVYGQVKMYLPTGKYKLIAVAANTSKPSPTNRIDVKSATEVVFPNGLPTDMSYVCKDVTISDGNKAQSIDCSLKRGISLLELKGTDYFPDNIKSFVCKVSGNCGNVFNPTTGFCTDTSTVTKTVDLQQYHKKRLNFKVYLCIGNNGTDNITLSTKTVNNNGETVKSLSFDKVHLVKGKKTTYNGPLFNPTSTMNFNVEVSNLEDSGYGVNFE